MNEAAMQEIQGKNKYNLTAFLLEAGQLGCHTVQPYWMVKHLPIAAADPMEERLAGFWDRASDMKDRKKNQEIKDMLATRVSKSHGIEWKIHSAFDKAGKLKQLKMNKCLTK